MASSLFAWLIPTAFPLVLALALVPRAIGLGLPTTRLRLHGALLFGALAGLLGVALESFFARFTGIDPRAQTLGDWSTLAALILLFAPVEEALKVAAFYPFHRLQPNQGRRGTIVAATLVALGYATIDTAHYLRGQGLDPLSFARALLAIPTHVFAAAAWAYAIGRAREDGEPADRSFVVAWLFASTLHGLYDHLLFGRGLATLFAVVPLLAAMAAVAYFAGRPLFARGAPLPSLRGRPLPPPPSMQTVRAAFRRAERPATLRWIALGSFVTGGVMIVSVVGTVFLAHRLGIDFSAVDEGQVTSTVPLLMLGGAVLAAFPFAGYLVARAHGTGSILEPAMGAGVAIAGALVMLGLIAPVAVVFGLAFAPVAFVLACAGAWFGSGVA